MNFLLHLRLNEAAGLPPAGAIIGDVLRGRLDPALPPALARSIALHRRIDALSDRHPALAPVKAGFAPGARRYAGIVLDLLCDHVAANDWTRYGITGESLEAFSHRMANAVADPVAWRVGVGKPAPGAARFDALLVGYRREAGIDRAIERITGRLARPAPFRDAARDWRDHIAATTTALPAVFDTLADVARGFALD